MKRLTIHYSERSLPVRGRFTILVLTLLISGCATAPSTPPPVRSIPPVSVPIVTPPPAEVEGFYYEIKKGDTIWRLARKYGLSIDQIAQVNNLASASRIAVGQKIFIPWPQGDPQFHINILYEDDGEFAWPVKGDIVSFFGARSSLTKNKGIDIAANYGQEVRAARSGKVSYVDENLKGYGKVIIVDHKEDFSTVYAYLSEIDVALGEVVGQNKTIAKVGSTGRAQRPTLHFEIRKKHVPKNPFYYLP